MTNLKSLTTEQVLHILKGYRCSRQAYTDTGDGMQLVDVFTPEGYSTVQAGLSELENLADYIAGQIAELPDEPPANSLLGIDCPNCGAPIDSVVRDAVNRQSEPPADCKHEKQSTTENANAIVTTCLDCGMHLHIQHKPMPDDDEPPSPNRGVAQMPTKM